MERISDLDGWTTEEVEDHYQQRIAELEAGIFVGRKSEVIAGLRQRVAEMDVELRDMTLKATSAESEMHYYIDKCDKAEAKVLDLMRERMVTQHGPRCKCDDCLTVQQYDAGHAEKLSAGSPVVGVDMGAFGGDASARVRVCRDCGNWRPVDGECPSCASEASSDGSQGNTQ